MVIVSNMQFIQELYEAQLLMSTFGENSMLRQQQHIMVPTKAPIFKSDAFDKIFAYSQGPNIKVQFIISCVLYSIAIILFIVGLIVGTKWAKENTFGPHYLPFFLPAGMFCIPATVLMLTTFCCKSFYGGNSKKYKTEALCHKLQPGQYEELKEEAKRDSDQYLEELKQYAVQNPNDQTAKQAIFQIQQIRTAKQNYDMQLNAALQQPMQQPTVPIQQTQQIGSIQQMMLQPANYPNMQPQAQQTVQQEQQQIQQQQNVVVQQPQTLIL